MNSSERQTSTLVFVINVDWFFVSHFLYLARRAKKAGFRVVIATHCSEASNQLRSEGFVVHALPRARTGGVPLSLPGAIIEVRRLLKDTGAVALHGFGAFGITVGAIASKGLSNLRRVYTITGRGYAAASQNVTMKAYRLWSRSFATYVADGTNVRWLAENQADIAAFGLNRARRENRAALLGGAGIDPDDFPVQPMPDRQPFKAILVARLIWSKGIDTAVNAVGIARANGVDVTLTLVGEPDPDNPRSFTERDITAMASQSGIEWLGRSNNVARLLANHHVAVLPSRGGEGVPKSLIEAAACGRPVITSTVPGCLELARETRGWAVACDDDQALADALMAAYVAPDLSERSEAARRAILSGYTQDANWKKIVLFYPTPHSSSGVAPVVQHSDGAAR